MDTRRVKAVIAESLGLEAAAFTFDIDRPYSDGTHERILYGSMSLSVALKEVHSSGEVDGYRRLLALHCCGDRENEYGIPQIFSLDADTRVVAMERVSGKTVSAALVAGRVGGAVNLHSLANRCGRWLGWFHRLEAAPATRFPAAHFLESLGEDIAVVRTANSSVAGQSFRLLGETAAAAGAEFVPCGLLHGDFKPDNLIVSESRVVGIDFEIIPQGMLLSDLVQFMNHVRLLCYEPAALGARLWREKATLENSFLRGYELEGHAVPRFPLAWLQIHHFCRMACDIQRRTKGLRRRYLAACVNRELSRLGRTLDSANSPRSAPRPRSRPSSVYASRLE